jgi:hypothetical protein
MRLYHLIISAFPACLVELVCAGRFHDFRTPWNMWPDRGPTELWHLATSENQNSIRAHDWIIVVVLMLDIYLVALSGLYLSFKWMNLTYPTYNWERTHVLSGNIDIPNKHGTWNIINTHGIFFGESISQWLATIYKYCTPLYSILE